MNKKDFSWTDDMWRVCWVDEKENQNFTVIVDYAHTPDGMDNVLKTIEDLAKKRVIIVFGCGGDRDKDKRPLMGKIALKYGDYILITTDNPRSENPKSIIKDILLLKSLKSRANVFKNLNSSSVDKAEITDSKEFKPTTSLMLSRATETASYSSS